MIADSTQTETQLEEDGQVFKMRFVDPATGDETVVEGVFPPEEWADLLAFAQYAEDGYELEMVKHGREIRHNVSWTEADGFRDNSVLPPTSEQREFIHVMRPLILKSDPTNFLRIANVLSKRLAHAYPRGIIGRLRDHFLADPKAKGFAISIDENIINSDESLDRWLNAYEYHRDRVKREQIHRTFEGDPPAWAYALYVLMLFEKLEACWTVAGMIRGMEKRGGAQFNVQFS